MNFLTIKKSSNRKTGPIPVTYGSRKTCPPSCPHYEDDCYGEDFTLAWPGTGLIAMVSRCRG